MKTLVLSTLCVITLGALAIPLSAQEKRLLWGDTHLHTSYSIDAYLMGNKGATPDTAYRFARGLPVVHPYSGVKVRLHRPLDFLVVSDHGEYLGIIQKIFAGDPLLMTTEIGRRWKNMQDEGNGRGAYFEAVGHANQGIPSPELQQDEVRRTVWAEIVAAAERYNQPGIFTSFVGWEWSSITDGANLHRVIVTDANQETSKLFLPYTLFDSDKPEDLWTWLAQTHARTGVEFVAIPHNSNISQGLMFPLLNSDGNQIDGDYARTRMRWEPIVEVTQIKGDSETHPDISPDDEFAGYEKFEKVMKVGQHNRFEQPEDRQANYVRSALKRGLAMAEQIDENPYKFGLIGSTDSHTALSTAEEDNFWGKMAIDSTPANTLDPNLAVVPPSTKGVDMSAAGIAAVWAEDNTRQSILSAFKRKEVYATTGPRIQLRFFGGFDFKAGDAQAPNLAALGYLKGTPMGGDLTPSTTSQAPSFLIEASMDPMGASLDRVQVIKGWVDGNGESHEAIFNVAWGGKRGLDAQGKLPPVPNTVNLQTLEFDNSTGEKRLATVWTDPVFSPQQRAFYYVRVLEIPTPRHTLYDAVALKVEHPDSHPATIQERAYSSPIWYAPL